MNFRLPEEIYSPDQIESALVKLRRYAQLRREDFNRRRLNIEPESAGADLLGELRPLLAAAGLGDNPAPDGIDHLIALLEEIKRVAPVIHFTLAAPAGRGLKRQLVDWVRRNLGVNILVSFSFDRTIVGGLVVRTDQRIYDWSWRESLLAKRDVIPQILQSLGRQAAAAEMPVVR